VEIVTKVRRAKGPSKADKEAFLEELIVRRELACNFVHFTTDYDSFEALPDWARNTLQEHKSDTRPTTYTRHQLESSETEDPYWNAAMQEMVKTGYMHNHMRMYWGKKIIEWTNTPRYAYSTALYLNNKYFLDGRDPNSYASIGWLFGLHDQAWGERPIFGKIRYMSAGGLERKFKINRYVRWVNTL
jgi:deoxyribodipyrimidine photo-lyase